MALQSAAVAGSANLMQAMGGSANRMLINSCNRNINWGFPTGQIPPSISLSPSNLTGESSAADNQDCDLSPGFMTTEPPWESNSEISNQQARDKAKLRYNEKKKTRMYVVQLLISRICKIVVCSLSKAFMWFSKRIEGSLLFF